MIQQNCFVGRRYTVNLAGLFEAANRIAPFFLGLIALGQLRAGGDLLIAEQPIVLAKRSKNFQAARESHDETAIDCNTTLRLIAFLCFLRRRLAGSFH